MNNVKIVQAKKPGLSGLRDVSVINGDTHIGRWVETEQQLDHDRHLPKIIADRFINRYSVVYDVGAFIGDHTCHYASRRPRAVVAFEPFHDAFECLSRNMFDYASVFTDVKLYRTALGNGQRIDPRSFVSGEPNKGARHLIPSPQDDANRTLHTVAIRLDQLLLEDDLLPPTVIKMDVEGWEPLVLSGMASTLIRHRPILVIEINRAALAKQGFTAETIHTYLKAHNYNITDIYNGEEFLPTDARDQFDVAATPW